MNCLYELIAPAKKVAANELARIYLDKLGSSYPMLTKIVLKTGTKTIPPPTPNRPLMKPPIIPKKTRIKISEYSKIMGLSIG